MKKALTTLLILLITTVGTFGVPQRADAIFGVGDISFDPAALAGTIAQTFSDVVGIAAEGSMISKEFVLDAIAWIAVKVVLQSLTQSITDWARNGFEGRPAFVTNVGSHLDNLAFETVSTYLDRDLEGLCGPFSLQVKGGLNALYNYNYDPVGCGLVGDVFTNAYILASSTAHSAYDIASGEQKVSFDDFYNLYTGESNNIYGAFIQAESGLNAAILDSRGNEVLNLTNGSGFLNKKTCITNEENGEEECYTNTPGTIISQQVNESLGYGADSLIAADEIDELLGSVFTALVNKTLTDKNGLSGGYVETSDDTFGYDNKSDGGASAFTLQNLEKQIPIQQEVVGKMGSILDSFFRDCNGFVLTAYKEVIDDAIKRATYTKAAPPNFDPFYEPFNGRKVADILTLQGIYLDMHRREVLTQKVATETRYGYTFTMTDEIRKGTKGIFDSYLNNRGNLHDYAEIYLLYVGGFEVLNTLIDVYESYTINNNAKDNYALQLRYDNAIKSDYAFKETDTLSDLLDDRSNDSIACNPRNHFGGFYSVPAEYLELDQRTDLQRNYDDFAETQSEAIGLLNDTTKTLLTTCAAYTPVSAPNTYSIYQPPENSDSDPTNDISENAVMRASLSLYVKEVVNQKYGESISLGEGWITLTQGLRSYLKTALESHIEESGLLDTMNSLLDRRDTAQDILNEINTAKKALAVLLGTSAEAKYSNIYIELTTSDGAYTSLAELTTYSSQVSRQAQACAR